MFKKVCSSPENNVVGTHDQQEILANPKLVKRMTKLANSLKAIAPKSDDFLYFSIVFLKAAESALLNENGTIKLYGLLLKASLGTIIFTSLKYLL